MSLHHDAHINSLHAWAEVRGGLDGKCAIVFDAALLLLEDGRPVTDHHILQTCQAVWPTTCAEWHPGYITQPIRTLIERGYLVEVGTYRNRQTNKINRVLEPRRPPDGPPPAKYSEKVELYFGLDAEGRRTTEFYTDREDCDWVVENMYLPIPHRTVKVAAKITEVDDE